MNLIMKSSFLFLAIILSACNTLEIQENYCEIAFAYPTNELLPEVLDKRYIGCACTSKDILQGEEKGAWKLYPLEKCRRVRGFHPLQWKTVIDPYFQYASARASKKSRKIKKMLRN